MIDPAKLSNLPKLNFLPPTPEIITPWGNNGLGEIIYLGHYARDIEELGRRERWFETIERVIRGTRAINAHLTSQEEDLLREHMLRLRGTVSGRALWQLGTPLIEKYGMDSLTNCLAGETMVVTKAGNKPIRDLAGKTQTLMTEGGKWVEAPVKSFGVQPLMAIHLIKDDRQKVIRATPEHTWLVVPTVKICKMSKDRLKITRKEIRDPRSEAANLKVLTKDLKPYTWLESPDKKDEWRVEKVEDLGIKEEVFCAVVPKTHTFALEDGLLTGNCWFTTITEPGDFRWLMDRLMVGGGVGFSVERSNIYKFPKIVATDIVHEDSWDTDLIVPDTRRGWSDLIERVIAAHLTGASFSYSTRAVRSAGTPLKTFGGKASGPNALIEGVESICKIMCGRVGKQLRSIDILDIANIIGGIVVAGSSRRSAEIALGDPDDALFITAKRWAKGTIPPWRGNSNNTIIVDNFEEIADDAPFWRNYDGGSEPYGLFNRRLARTMGRLGEKKADPTVEGINPCFAADTRILTTEGWRTFNELAGLNPKILQDARVEGRLENGQEKWAVNPSENGTVVNQASDVRMTARQQQLYRLTTNDGRTVRATANHHFATPEGMVTLDKLQIGQALLVALPDPYVAARDSYDWRWGYLLGLAASNGYLDKATQKAKIAIWDTARILDAETERIEALVEQTIAEPAFVAARGWSKRNLGWIHQQSRDLKAGFVSGLFYGDGSIQDAKGSLNWHLVQSNRAFISDVQLVLQELGVRANLLYRRAARQISMPDGRGGRALYDVQANYELIISGRRQCERAEIVLEIPLHHRSRWEALQTRDQKSTDRDLDVTTIASIEPDAVEDVWCLSEDSRRTLVAEGLTARRCGESQLANRESCNLATLWLPNVESFDQFTEISKILYKIQKATALLHHPDPVTEAIVHKNLRLGQNVTGIFQGSQEQRDWMSPGYEVLRAFDKEWSRKLGVNESVRLTTVQPGGTLSNLPGVTSGVHAAWSEYYIRRARFGATDSIIDLCRKRGYPVVPEIGLDGNPNHTRLVVEFPCKAPAGTPLASQDSALTQLDRLVWAQRNFSDQAVSVTVTYKPEELPEIKKWLSEHYDHEVKSVSFLLYSGHGFALAPYEEITKEEYERRASKIKVNEEVDLHGTSVIDDTDCAAGGCPVR